MILLAWLIFQQNIILHDSKIIFTVKANDENFGIDGNGSYSLKDSTHKPLTNNNAFGSCKSGHTKFFFGNFV